MAYLRNSTFETGLAGWNRINGANQVTMAIINDGTARSGQNFLRAKSDVVDGSVGTDFAIPSTSGAQPAQADNAMNFSVGALAYIRAAPGGPPVQGHFKLWSLGLESRPENSNGTNFRVGNDWSLIMCALDGTSYQYLRAENRYGFPTIRVEFYLQTPGAYLDIDTVFVS
ncbi:hypothetical protein H4P12_07375 [Paracoccus sp. 11-3]|uniref:Uncharacterized protein n=1 Tax=Paracoccus amoyensis TaxID=2760093 RepID=A0A926JC49_9RHOB|nr:hypothetical protein [Paracoccus amoyensis]MBC9246535.1 hypothetical protein [Paracoccus amoyensis]